MHKKKIYDRPRIEVVKAETSKTLCGSIGGGFDPDAMP